MPRFGKSLPARLREGFESARVDLIVHCGDMTDAMVIPLLEALAPLEAVAGNNDPPALARRFGRHKVLEFGSVRIGVTHGHEGTGRSTMARAQNAFANERVDAILFGHSHVPHCDRHGGVLLFNPGSPTDKRRQPNYSFGIIRIAENEVNGELVFFADKR